MRDATTQNSALTKNFESFHPILRLKAVDGDLRPADKPTEATTQQRFTAHLKILNAPRPRFRYVLLILKGSKFSISQW